MIRIAFIFLSLAALSCNSGPKPAPQQEAHPSAASHSYTWTEAEEKEFLSGCVDSAKLKLGEAAAYARCKCILGQLKQAYPNMDSAAPALMDVKKVAAMAAQCK